MNRWLVVVLLIAASTADAAVHKCKAPDGRIIYTDNGCPQDQEVTGKDRSADESSHGNGATAGRAADGGRGGYYRQQIKSAEQSAPKPDPPRP